MSRFRLEEQKQRILASLVRLASQRVAPAQLETAERFIRSYFSQMDADDFVDRSEEDIYGAAMAHLSFGREFAGGTAKLRVYNPRAAEHGWTSSHSIIEIVADDMPFLVDSTTMEINRQGYTLHLFVHPIFHVQRDAAHRLEALSEDGVDGVDGLDGARESFMHIEIDREIDPERLQALAQGLSAVLADVRAAVTDWPAMKRRMAETLGELQTPPIGMSPSEVAAGREFLAWAHDNNFTFLGYREHDLVTLDGEDRLKLRAHSGLGVLRADGGEVYSSSFDESPPEIRKLARTPCLLVLTKATARSTVHRPGYLDYIGIKRFDAEGNVIGERRFVGLYTSSAYHAHLSEIPLLRDKAATVLRQAGFPASSHMGKNLFAILEGYPRDELFQIDAATLFDTVMGILRLGDRRKTHVFVRREAYGRFFSCFIYLPRDKYTTEIRMRIQDILKRRLHGVSTEFTVQLSDAVLARIHMLIRTASRDAASVTVDMPAIEAELALAVRDWSEDLKSALIEALGEDAAMQQLRSYAAFPLTYREQVGARAAVRDIETMGALSATNPLALSLYRPLEAQETTLRLRVYRFGQPMPLSGSLPMLENMGVTVGDEQSFALSRADGERIYIHDFGLSTTRVLADIAPVKPLFEAAFAKVWRREAESDGFNRLVLACGLAGDEVAILRALAKYLKQTGFTFSQSYIEQTLFENSAVARLLIDLFHVRFNPAFHDERAAAQARTVQQIENALNQVASADDDRILRRFLAVLLAVVRTNAYQRDAAGRRKSYVSFKLESAKVPELPAPRPLYEIWVYSPRFEGIHLRGGKVARGGLRWSDRIEDFRTEVLGLVKAQMVKNAVIVPVGSKGGFVLKNPPPPAERDAYLKEGVACYQTFLRGLLDLTDNLVANRPTPPRDVVRHDGDDPYLVVAADKGTASFSDYANAVSTEYGHWLGDAFASGGSVGYDHKKMGITARGAWESVKRHFFELGVDTRRSDFTVVGIGDMSGDVLGNGMLLSRHIRLVAAFDHRHIFLDPNPDAATSFGERKRLFDLPRSSWDDYDKRLISEGGGVFPRSAKSIALTPEARAALSLADETATMTPSALIRALLTAKVDLLYNGGIGTYVKASSQSHAEVGDRATDAVRVDGKDLRCKVVAEGGNLGFTQLGRIEYALSGGRINTDAIDNSAGVDCSDHEVNIKILLGSIEADGELTAKQRNQLLAEMSDEVGRLVLADNYYQTQTLSVSGVRGDKLLDAQSRFIRRLEKSGRLDRAVEFLPNDEELARRRAARLELTSPERAVLLAYSKMELFDRLVASDLLDDDYVGSALIDYFPHALRERYSVAMLRHPLRREIIATVLANSTINHVGSVFVHRMQEETGAEPHEVVRAYMLVRDVFGFERLWAEIEALDGQAATRVQYEMLIAAGRLVLRAVLWFLRVHHGKTPMAAAIARFRPSVELLRDRFEALLNAGDLQALREAQARLEADGVPTALAAQVASLDAFYAVLDIVEIANESRRSVEQVAAVYFALVGELDMRWFAQRIAALPNDTHWQGLARNALRDDLSWQQRLLTGAVLALSPAENDTACLVLNWKRANAPSLARLQTMVANLRALASLDLSMLSVLLRELRALA